MFFKLLAPDADNALVWSLDSGARISNKPPSRHVASPHHGSIQLPNALIQTDFHDSAIDNKKNDSIGLGSPTDSITYRRQKNLLVVS